jgi:uncharacterized membrane protein
VTVGPGAKLQTAALTAGLFAYALLCHHLNSAGDAPGFGAAVALGPLLAAAGVLAWRNLHPLKVALIALLAGGALTLSWPYLKSHFAAVFLLQECGFFGLLALGFVRSLRTGSIAFCTRFADSVHGPLSPAEVRYTRGATAAWALFFAAMVVIDAAVFFTLPLRVWSFFVNFCTLPLVLLVFAAEYAVRRRVLPQSRGAGLVATVRIYFARSA